MIPSASPEDGTAVAPSLSLSYLMFTEPASGQNGSDYEQCRIEDRQRRIGMLCAPLFEIFYEK